MLTKIVDGVTVECSPEEEAQMRKEWADNEKAPIAKPAPTVSKLIAALEKKGVLAKGEL